MRIDQKLYRLSSSLVLILGVCLAPQIVGGCQSSSLGEGAHIYEGFGNYERAITTDSPDSQLWFNQGMQLMYGFNHDEAIRSFEKALTFDDEAAMPWWGIAYCHGININDPKMTEERSRLAREAADKALARLDNESPIERALVEALSARYEYPAPKDRTPLDEAYAAALGHVYDEFVGDSDVAALYAESLMNLQPWDYWAVDGEPKGRIEEVMSILEEVLVMDSHHPGGNHFYIHASEASKSPDRAVPAAERLLTLVPGSGHLVHMPSHIFIRVGRYADAAASNSAAIEADRTYFTKAPAPGLYAMYYAHNLHFLAFASMMSGDFETAIGAARDLESEVPEQALRDYASLFEGIMPTSLHVLIRFGKWEQILEEPDYPDWRFMSRATWSYARSVASSAMGLTEQARSEMAEFEKRVALVPSDWMVFNNSIDTILPIARAVIQGELLYREGKHEEAFAILREGIAHEDSLVYDEPPAWMLPVRHALGALMMGAGQYQAAEQVYREDLERNTKNGWALTGLRAALFAQGRSEEARAYDEPIAAAFASSDTLIESSCFCEP
ncbi:MAG: tetratricopeptide (TPR) repeat protein [Planctomycetota bacterium]|jgi:tetratricopeptide (TPR) repeat protein